MPPPFRRHPRRGPNDGLLWSGWLPFGHQHRIEVKLHLFFAFTPVAVAWLLAMAVLPRLFPGWQPASYWGVATVIAVTDGMAGLAHELGHAAMAMARGRYVSRITLYGLAAAVRRSGGPMRSRDQVLISVAGPLSHLVVAGAFWAVWMIVPGDNEPLRVAAGLPALSNLAAGVLNLLPVASLDGGRAARALMTGLFRV